MHRSIKRLRMVRDKLRLRGDWLRSNFMLVGCGLHNLRVRGQRWTFLAHERTDFDK